MSDQASPSLTAVIVAVYDKVSLTRATVRSVSGHGQVPCLVIDVDGTYSPVGDELVVGVNDVVRSLDLVQEATSAASTLDPAHFAFYAGVLGAAYAKEQGSAAVMVLGAGVQALSDLRDVPTDTGDVVVVPFTDATSVVRRAAAAPVHVRRDWHTGHLLFEGSGAGVLFSRALYTVHTADQVALLRGLAADWRVADSALDTFAVAVNATVVGTTPLLVTPWRAIGETALDAGGHLCVGGVRARALDLTAFDAQRPWVLDAQATASPRVLLSEHPTLARMTEAEAAVRTADQEGLDDARAGGETNEPDRVRLDPVLRTEARRAERARGRLPDLLGLGVGDDLESWALEMVPAGDPMPAARYLAAIQLARPDLQHVYRHVPGVDAANLAGWALRHGVGEPVHDAALLARGAELTIAAQTAAATLADGPRPRGVNLVGYLSGELGLGESARLVDDALQSADVATSTYDVSRDLESRKGANYRKSDPVMYDTTLICVNGAETSAVAPQLDNLIKRTRVIGMWYWELEDFPKAHQAGFDHVDEVWAATDFVRDAIAKHSGDIPVRTVTPPLPQAGDDPGTVPDRFGIPTERPWFLFTFDFLSLATRKNPYGLVEAFTRAFADVAIEERPLLVIKTINADSYPAHAERLRFQIAGRSDVVFLDTYLDNHERHVLVSHCTAYVSLHKAEGLGLTVAEAMAWGRPVITTAYGGVTQFCTKENSFLVDWERGYIDEAAGPYLKGLPWAEPDLDQAAALMRRVIDDPAHAAAIGDRAAQDIRERHNARVAGAHMRQVLEQGEEEWRAKRAEARARRQARRRERERERRREAELAVTTAEASRTPSTAARRLAAGGRATARRMARAASHRMRLSRDEG